MLGLLVAFPMSVEDTKSLVQKAVKNERCAFWWHKLGTNVRLILRL